MGSWLVQRDSAARSRDEVLDGDLDTFLERVRAPAPEPAPIH